jgi:hypothetical protein
MLANRRLVLDNFSEVYELLLPWANESFYDFSYVTSVPGSVYVVGRQQLMDHRDRIRDMCESGQYVMVFGNSAEGSWTLEMQLRQLKIHDLVIAKKLLLISGAGMNPEYPYLSHEHFLSRILDYEENLQAQQYTKEIFSNVNKPYKFLFLNGRARPHRKYLYERFKELRILDQSLYTMLDAKPAGSQYFQLRKDGINVMETNTPLQHLPSKYEVSRYRKPEFGPIDPKRTNLKQELFSREWGEIYLEPQPYIDTYFSLVTETICAESTHSFRTEKIAKPLAMGHPFIAATTPGFYRDLHHMGFQTFGHVIDESFDQIDHAQTRMDRIVDIVNDLCQQDLVSFLKECYTVCKYNQQHLVEVIQQERQQFPDRFQQFIQQYTQ